MVRNDWTAKAALFLLVIAPLIYGCQPPWASGFLIAAVLFLSAIHIFTSVLRGSAWGFNSRALEWSAILLLAWLAANVSRDWMLGPSQGRVAAISLQKLCYAAAFGGAAVLGSSFASNLDRIRVTLRIIAGLGLALSIFALLEVLKWDVKSLAGWIFSDHSRPSGIYTNANRFAVLLSICWTSGFALLLNLFIESRGRLRNHLGELLFFSAEVISSGIFIALTLSRLTMVATAAALCVMSLVYFLLNRRDRNEEGFELPLHQRLTPLMIPLVMIAGWGAWCLFVGNTQLRNRFADLADVSPEGRAAVVTSALPLLKSEPLWGHGLGMFESIFTALQPATLPGRWREVHSDWLQLAIEAGFPALLLMLTASVLWCRSVWRRLRAEKPAGGLLLVFASAGILVVMICSVADFPLREPATATLVFFLAGVLAGRRQSFTGVAQKLEFRSICAAALALALLCGAFISGRNALAYLSSPWMGKIYCPTNYSEQSNAWDKAEAIDNDDPEIKFRRASALFASANGKKDRLLHSRDVIEQARKIQPHDYRFPMLEAGIAEVLSDLDSATALREEAAVLAPTQSTLREQNGLFYLRNAVVRASPGEPLHDNGLEKMLGNFRAVIQSSPGREPEIVATMEAAGCLNTEVAQLWPGDNEKSRLRRALYFCSNNQWDMADRQLAAAQPGGARESAYYHAVRGAVALKREDLEHGSKEWKAALSLNSGGTVQELDNWMASQAAELKLQTCEAIAEELLPELERYPALAGRLAMTLASGKRLALADRLLEKVANKSPDLSAQWAELALEAGDMIAATDRARMTYEHGMSSPRWNAWYEQFRQKLKQQQPGR